MHGLPHFNTPSSKFNQMANSEAIQLALDDLKSQDVTNFAATAKKHNVDRTVLMRRFKGQTVSNREAHSTHHQLLTDAQEEVLLQHISNLSDRGMPPTPQILENLVV